MSARLDARAQAAATWAQRVRAEREATRRYADLAARLARAGGDAALVDGLGAAGEDEAHHAGVCAAVVEHLGGVAPPAGAARGLDFAPASLAAEERLAYELVAFVCVNETLNSALLFEARRHASDGVVRDALHVLGADELRHARLGFTCLAWWHARGRGPLLAAALPRMLGGAVRDELFADGPDPRDQAAAASLGELSRRDRRALLEMVLREVIWPGFARLGLDTTAGRAWAARVARIS